MFFQRIRTHLRCLPPPNRLFPIDLKGQNMIPQLFFFGTDFCFGSGVEGFATGFHVLEASVRLSETCIRLSETSIGLSDTSIGLSLLRPRSPSCSVARSLGRSIARSLDRSIVRSLDRSLARSLAGSLARSALKDTDNDTKRH